MARTDRPILPGWILNIFYADIVNKAYIGLLHGYHTMNNPIAYAANECLLLSMADKSQFILSLGDKAQNEEYLEEKSAQRMKLIRVRNKFWVAIILMKRPKLQKLRKNFIAWGKEQRRMLKEKKRQLEAEINYESENNKELEIVADRIVVVVEENIRPSLEVVSLGEINP